MLSPEYGAVQPFWCPPPPVDQWVEDVLLTTQAVLSRPERTDALVHSCTGAPVTPVTAGRFMLAFCEPSLWDASGCRDPDEAPENTHSRSPQLRGLLSLGVYAWPLLSRVALFSAENASVSDVLWGACCNACTDLAAWNRQSSKSS
jgi:hypothetical protein